MDHNREPQETPDPDRRPVSSEYRPEERAAEQPAVWESYNLNILTAFFDG